jgi:hypothetical protein
MQAAAAVVPMPAGETDSQSKSQKDQPLAEKPAAAAAPTTASCTGSGGAPASAAPTQPRVSGRFGPPIPVSVLTDSYKASHFLMYPDARLMVAYGEFRQPYAKDPEDSRFVFYGR